MRGLAGKTALVTGGVPRIRPAGPINTCAEADNAGLTDISCRSACGKLSSWERFATNE